MLTNISLDYLSVSIPDSSLHLPSYIKNSSGSILTIEESPHLPSGFPGPLSWVSQSAMSGNWGLLGPGCLARCYEPLPGLPFAGKQRTVAWQGASDTEQWSEGLLMSTDKYLHRLMTRHLACSHTDLLSEFCKGQAINTSIVISDGLTLSLTIEWAGDNTETEVGSSRNWHKSWRMHKTALKLLKHPNNDQYYKVAIVKLFTSIIEYKSGWPSFLNTA